VDTTARRDFVKGHSLCILKVVLSTRKRVLPLCYARDFHVFAYCLNRSTQQHRPRDPCCACFQPKTLIMYGKEYVLKRTGQAKHFWT
jgi:hypothetical protein